MALCEGCRSSECCLHREQVSYLSVIAGYLNALEEIDPGGVEVRGDNIYVPGVVEIRRDAANESWHTHKL